MSEREHEAHCAVLYLLCGLPGSGKTTWAVEATKRDGGVIRLSPDEWIHTITDRATGAADPAVDPALNMEELRDSIEKIQWQLAQQLLERGVSVILENGFWSEHERERYRTKAKRLGARVKLVFLNATFDALWDRIDRRNRDEQNSSFPVTEAELESWWGIFEPPTAEELKRYD